MPTGPLPVGVRLLQQRVLDLMLRRRGLSQRALAARLEVAPVMVSRWMCGRVVLSCYWIQRLASVLELSPMEELSLVACAARLDYERMCAWRPGPNATRDRGTLRREPMAPPGSRPHRPVASAVTLGEAEVGDGRKP